MRGWEGGGGGGSGEKITKQILGKYVPGVAMHYGTVGRGGSCRRSDREVRCKNHTPWE